MECPSAAAPKKRGRPIGSFKKPIEQPATAAVATIVQYVPAEPVMITMPKQVRKRQPKAESVSNSPG